MKKVLGISGSKRKSGNTATLVQKALEVFKDEDEMEVEMIYLGDYDIKGCTGCEGCKDSFRCVIKDDMQSIYPRLMEADAIILGSPTYFYNISSDTKAFIDRLYCFEVISSEDRAVWMGINEALGGKYALVIAVCEQEDEVDMGFTAEAMSMPLEALGYRVLEKVKILHLYKNNEAAMDDRALERVSKAGNKMLKTLKLRDLLEEKLKTEMHY